MQKIIRQTIDLRGGGGELCWPDTLAVQGEIGGHRWQVRVLEGGAPANLQGATAECFVVNGDVTTRVSAAIAGSDVSVVFSSTCYAQSGELRAILRVYTPDGAEPAMALLRLRVQEGITDVIADPEHVIPSLHQLLVQFDACKESTEKANEAARGANDAAAKAEQAGQTAIANANAAGQTAIAKAEEAGQTAIANANAAGQSAIAKAEEAGQTAIANANAAGQTAIAAAEDANTAASAANTAAGKANTAEASANTAAGKANTAASAANTAAASANDAAQKATDAAAAAKTTADTAATAANTAAGKANTAATAANSAADAANTAAGKANTAADAANTAASKADTAADTANTAAGKANTAASTANTAADAANTAAGKANTAEAAANTAAGKANTAASAANTAAASADTAASAANTAAGRADTAATAANTATGAANTAASAANTATGAANTAADTATAAAASANAAATDANEATSQLEYTLHSPHNALLDGANLKTVFGTAQALHDAVAAGDFSKIRVGDYWPITLSGTYRNYNTAAIETIDPKNLNLEVAGINVYSNYGDGTYAIAQNHLVLCSRELLNASFTYRSKSNATNWYDTTYSNPWYGSHLYQILNASDGILPLVLATDLGPYVFEGPWGKGMHILAEIKGQGETDATTNRWIDRGRLFLPTEREIFGAPIFSDPIWSAGVALQWPIFSGSMRHIMKTKADEVGSWWCQDSVAGTADEFVGIYSFGFVRNFKSTWTSFGGLSVPICFILV